MRTMRLLACGWNQTMSTKITGSSLTSKTKKTIKMIKLQNPKKNVFFIILSTIGFRIYLLKIY